MGIRYLNKFLRTECKGDNIKFISIAELSGKKIAVDISIYLYKFSGEDSLIENMYLMLSIFRNYGVIPIFIFDGKAPTEKKELLRKRSNDKSAARNEFNTLKMQLAEDGNKMDNEEKQELMNAMDILKKKFITIKKEQIEEVKDLIRAYGATYFDAPGEADELCASLVIKNKVWACLSEDTDMFVYGCTRVLRYFSLMNHTIVLYNTKGILDELGISQKELREICVLSGTDYNCDSEPSLYITLKHFKKFHKETKNKKNLELDFYTWLLNNTNYIDDYERLKLIYNMFDLNTTINSHENIEIFENISIRNGYIMQQEIYNILANNGFIMAAL